MKIYEKMLAARLLEMAADTYSNHGCNDVDQNLYSECGLSDEDKEVLLREMRAWNGGDDPWPEKITQIGDSSLMQFFASKLRNKS